MRWEPGKENLEYRREPVGVKDLEGDCYDEVTLVSHVFTFHQWSHITSCASF